MEGFLPGFASVRGAVEARLIASVHKKRAGKQSVWSISPLFRPFSCGKNGISLLKEIYFLPQRRGFLAAKKFPGVWKAGKNGASGGFFLLVGGRPRAKSGCLFASLSPRSADAGRHLSAWRPVGGGKVSRKPGSRLSSCILASPRDSHISVRLRPCVRPRDSRGGGFDVLTEWHLGFSAARRASGGCRDMALAVSPEDGSIRGHEAPKLIATFQDVPILRPDGRPWCTVDASYSRSPRKAGGVSAHCSWRMPHFPRLKACGIY